MTVKISGSETVIDFGMAGDNSFNNTTLLQNQIALAANSGTSKNLNVRFPPGTFLIDGVSIPAGYQNITFSGSGNGWPNGGASIIKGRTGAETLFTFGDGVEQIKFRDLEFYSAAKAMYVPDSCRVAKLEFSGVTFIGITDKAVHVVDSSGSKGLIGATFTNTHFYGCKHGFYSDDEAESNNIHFDKCSFESATAGGSYIRIGGNELITCTTITVRDTLFEGSASSFVPIQFGRLGTFKIDGCHFADFGMVTAHTPLIRVLNYGGGAPLCVTIQDSDIANGSGPIIENQTGGVARIGYFVVINSLLQVFQTDDPIVTNADQMASLTVIGGRWAETAVTATVPRQSFINVQGR